MTTSQHEHAPRPDAGTLDVELRMTAAAAVAVLVFTALTHTFMSYFPIIVATMLTISQLRHGSPRTAALDDDAISRGPFWTLVLSSMVLAASAIFLTDLDRITVPWLLRALVAIISGTGSFLVVRWNMRIRSGMTLRPHPAPAAGAR